MKMISTKFRTEAGGERGEGSERIGRGIQRLQLCNISFLKLGGG